METCKRISSFIYHERLLYLSRNSTAQIFMDWVTRSFGLLEKNEPTVCFWNCLKSKTSNLSPLFSFLHYIFCWITYFVLWNFSRYRNRKPEQICCGQRFYSTKGLSIVFCCVFSGLDLKSSLRNLTFFSTII